MTTIFVKELLFYAHHGVTPEERAVGHRFRLDLSCEVGESARETDRIQDTADYAAMARLSVKVAQEKPYLTVERAAMEIGNQLLAAFPQVGSVLVRLAKIAPSIELSATEVGVEMVVRRPS